MDNEEAESIMKEAIERCKSMDAIDISEMVNSDAGMKETILNIEQIETLLVGYPSSPFYIRRNIVIPNVSWGFLNHEADLVAISKAGCLTEIEIKRTWSDFLADFEKKHNHYDPKLSHFYYAVPESIVDRVFEHLYKGILVQGRWYYKATVTGYTKNNPLKCGLIFYKDPSECNPNGIAEIVVTAKRMNYYKISVSEENKLLRLLGMRIWNLKKKIAESSQY